MDDNKSTSANDRRSGKETVAGRAREMAAQIEQLPEAVKKSFAGGQPVQDRVAQLGKISTEIAFGMVPVVSWVERHAHPETAMLLKRRVDMVLGEAVACVHYDIPEYATGTPQRVSDQPSVGLGRTCILLVTTKLVSAYLRDWANDIEIQESPPVDEKTDRSRGRGKTGGEKWRKAQKRMIDLQQKDMLPSTLRQAAKVLLSEGFTYNTVRDAAHKSTILLAHFNLSSEAEHQQAGNGGGSLLDELVEQADKHTRQAIEQMTPQQRQEAEATLKQMGPQKTLELFATLTTDPDAGRTGDVSLIENADQDTYTDDWSK